jgi:cytochrome bd ubiquinol oxidase subunit I
MQTVGNIAGPLLAYEVLTAFFLEATFLGIMLFGYAACQQPGAYAGNSAGGRRHDDECLLDSGAQQLDAYAGRVRDARCRRMVAHATDWWAIVFNPSIPYRFAHMMTASFLTCAFLLAGISAYRWLRGDRTAGREGGGDAHRECTWARC